MHKRISAFILALVLSLFLSLTTLASPSVEAQYQYTDDSIVYVEGGLLGATSQNNAYSTNSQDAGDAVSYSYTIAPDSTTEDRASVTLDFLWQTDGHSVLAQATGTINSYQLSDGKTLWDGVLSGTAEFNENEYIVLVGFSKMDNSEAIQANVTIQTNEELIVMFSFGETIQSEYFISNAEHTETANTKNTLDTPFVELTSLATDRYAPIVSTSTEYTVGSNTRDVLTTTAFFDPINNRCLINLQSDTEMMKELFSVAYSVDIKKVSYQLTYDVSKEISSAAGNNVANLDGFWGVAPLTMYEPESDGSYFIEDLFSAILEAAFDYFCGSFLPVKLGASFLPISSDIANTVTSLFEEATGYVAKDTSDATYHTLIIDYGDKTGLHYDDSGMPTVFVVEAGPSFNAGQSAYYTATTSIMYRITTNGGGTAPGTRFYITINGGLDSFGLPLAT